MDENPRGTETARAPWLLSEEVRAALEARRAVVALETSVLAHGLPSPQNAEAAYDLDVRVRHEGAVPAWVSVEAGAVRVGLSSAQLAALCAASADIAKVARRDLPAVLVTGRRGATTVSATIAVARAVGIEVSVTGGIGGVHPASDDVSADLVELARTPGVLVCSGPKSIVDVAATMDRLEELGVPVVGFGCDRLPGFVATDAGLPLEHRVDTADQVAQLAISCTSLGMRATLVVCHPVPPIHAVDPALLAAAVGESRQRAAAAGITGKALTPYLLRTIAALTDGASLRANLALLSANASLAARIAVALAHLRRAAVAGGGG